VDFGCGASSAGIRAIHVPVGAKKLNCPFMPSLKQGVKTPMRFHHHQNDREKESRNHISIESNQSKSVLPSFPGGMRNLALENTVDARVMPLSSDEAEKKERMRNTTSLLPRRTHHHSFIFVFRLGINLAKRVSFLLLRICSLKSTFKYHVGRGLVSTEICSILPIDAIPNNTFCLQQLISLVVALAGFNLSRTPTN
jgi:hypothetical protein